MLLPEVLAGSVDGLLRTGIQMDRLSLASSFCVCSHFRQCWVLLGGLCDGAVMLRSVII